MPRNDKAFPYRKLVGSLNFITKCTRPDILYCVVQLSRYVRNSRQQQNGVTKQVFCSSIETNRHNIVYLKDKMAGMVIMLTRDGYCHLICKNDLDTRKCRAILYIVSGEVLYGVHCDARASWLSRQRRQNLRQYEMHIWTDKIYETC